MAAGYPQYHVPYAASCQNLCASLLTALEEKQMGRKTKTKQNTQEQRSQTKEKGQGGRERGSVSLALLRTVTQQLQPSPDHLQ